MAKSLMLLDILLGVRGMVHEGSAVCGVPRMMTPSVSEAVGM